MAGKEEGNKNFRETQTFRVRAPSSEGIVKPINQLHYYDKGRIDHVGNFIEPTVVTFVGYAEKIVDGKVVDIGARFLYRDKSETKELILGLGDASSLCIVPAKKNVDKTKEIERVPLFPLKVKRSEASGGVIEEGWIYNQTFISSSGNTMVQVMKYLEEGRAEERLEKLENLLDLNVRSV